MLAGRTGKTTDKLQSEFCMKYLSFFFNLSEYSPDTEGSTVILCILQDSEYIYLLSDLKGKTANQHLTRESVLYKNH